MDLDRPSTELGGIITSLGISLAGHKDRSQMATYICGLNPNGKRQLSLVIGFGDGFRDGFWIQLCATC